MVIQLKPRAVAPAPRLFGVVPPQVPPTAPPTALMFVSESVNEAPVSVVVVLLLPRVRASVEFEPAWIEVGVKVLEIVGGAGTVRLGVLPAVPADGVCVVATPDVLFGPTPGELLVTSNLPHHLAF